MLNHDDSTALLDRLCNHADLEHQVKVKTLKQKRRVHITDLVTVSCRAFNYDQRLCTVVGETEIGKREDMEGLWIIQDIKTDKKMEMPGMFITVWRPVLPPRERKPY